MTWVGVGRKSDFFFQFSLIFFIFCFPSWFYFFAITDYKRDYCKKCDRKIVAFLRFPTLYNYQETLKIGGDAERFFVVVIIR